MNKTFIIGAGASYEVGMPLGYDLLKYIGSSLNFSFDQGALKSGDIEIFNALLERCKREKLDINDFVKEARFIHETAPLNKSIDNLIDKNRGNTYLEFVGKVSIAKFILKYEKSCYLSFDKFRDDGKMNYSSLEHSWYLPFYKMLTERCSSGELVERFSKITLIIFNYDRCIEHFLFEAIKNDYRLNDIETAAIIDSLTIFHPYGSVGVLPQLEMGLESKQIHVKFGNLPIPNKLLSLAAGIKTFTEGTNPEDTKIVEMRSKLFNADKVVFLGFAFEPLNMELLKPLDTSDPPEYKRNTYATVMGVSPSNLNYIKKKISALFNDKSSTIITSDMKCSQFMNEHSEGLSIINE